MTILKYTLDTTGNLFNIPLPSDAVILSVHERDNYATMWVLLDDDAEEAFKLNRTFYCIWTGKHFEKKETDKFLGTVLLDEGSFVVHGFERKE